MLISSFKIKKAKIPQLKTKNFMQTIKLFTDGSVNPQTNIGFASYLLITNESKNIETLKSEIQIKKFGNTSSTKLELQGLLWALESVRCNNTHIIVYTDCQNILTLQNRRERFEKNNYMTKKGILIANHELYKEFYTLTDSLSCSFIKLKGHKKEGLKDEIDKLFTLVDKASRTALREFNTECNIMSKK